MNGNQETDAILMEYTNADRGPVLITPTIITILASYNCTAACEHCCFDSHPGIKQRLSLEDIINFVDKAVSAFPTMQMVVFSGGECFLLGRDLIAGVRYATSLGLATRCVTNGYWAFSEQSAMRRLEELKGAGLTEINFSTGDFHQKYVPQSHVINGVIAALKLGIQTVVVVEVQASRSVTGRGIMADERWQALATTYGQLFKIIESPWMPMKLTDVVPQDQEQCVNASNVHTRTGCDSILTTIVATPNNQLGVCCGLSREHIPELNVDLAANSSFHQIWEDSANDFMKIWLFVEGPERILAWAASKDPLIDWENRYAHHCHACLRLFQDQRVRTVIREHYPEKVSEVLLRYSLMARARATLLEKQRAKQTVRRVCA